MSKSINNVMLVGKTLWLKEDIRTSNPYILWDILFHSDLLGIASLNGIFLKLSQFWCFLILSCHIILAKKYCQQSKTWGRQPMTSNITWRETSFTVLSQIFEPPHDKTNILTVRPVKTQISLAQLDAQADQSLRCALNG